MARLETELIDHYRTMKKSSLDKDKTLVIVIDMVKGFAESGAMADQAIAKITPDIQKLLKFYPHHLYFCDAHQPDSVELGIFPSHCIKGTTEAELLDAFIDDAQVSPLIEKNSTNGFVAPDFLRHAVEIAEQYDHFILTGCCTDICVLQFGLSWAGYLAQHNYRNKTIYLPLNAVDTYHIPGTHDASVFNKMAVHLMENAGIHILRKIG